MSSAAERDPGSHALHCPLSTTARISWPTPSSGAALTTLADSALSPSSFHHSGLATSSHASCISISKASAVASAQSSEPTWQRSFASRYRCAASTSCPELPSAAPRPKYAPGLSGLSGMASRKALAALRHSSYASPDCAASRAALSAISRSSCCITPPSSVSVRRFFTTLWYTACRFQAPGFPGQLTQHQYVVGTFSLTQIGQTSCFSRSSPISDGSLAQPKQARLIASDAGKGAPPSSAVGGVAAAGGTSSAGGGTAAAASVASRSAFSDASASRTSLLPAPRSGCCSRSLASSGLGPRPGLASHSPRTASRRPSAMRQPQRRPAHGKFGAEPHGQAMFPLSSLNLHSHIDHKSPLSRRPAGACGCVGRARRPAAAAARSPPNTAPPPPPPPARTRRHARSPGSPGSEWASERASERGQWV
eukprot:scaffold40501_cov65-Phaeocystis_antarctica.AAC.2